MFLGKNLDIQKKPRKNLCAHIAKDHIHSANMQASLLQPPALHHALAFRVCPKVRPRSAKSARVSIQRV